jgi:hypothetical protein
MDEKTRKNINLDKETKKALNALVSAINNVYLDKKKLIIRSFISGIAYGLGITLGLAIVFVIIATILEYIIKVPILGTYVYPLASHLHQIKINKP